MEVKVSMKQELKDLYGFLMFHIYSSPAGILGLFISIGGFVGFAYMLTLKNTNPMFLGALFMIGLMFTVIQPLLTRSRAKKQIKQNEEKSQDVLEYVINKSGIEVTQGELRGFSSWDEIVRIESTKKLVMLYTSKVHAYVIPKRFLEEQMDTFIELVKENCQAGYIKL